MQPAVTGPNADARVPGAVDPSVVLAVPSLELRARWVVEGFRRGLHRSLYRGSSVERSDTRPYVAGDDVRFIDWRCLARTDRLYVKRFEDETNLRAHLLVDASASMAFGPPGREKAAYAATLAASLAHLFAGQGDAVGVVRFADRPLEVVPARLRPGHLARVEAVLSAPPEGRATSIDAALADVPAVIPRRGLVVLVSDLLAEVGDLGRRLRALVAMGHEAIVLQIADPAELSLDLGPGDAPVRLRDLESGAAMPIDPAAARAGYRAARAAHDRSVVDACLGAGVDHVFVRTDRPFEDALLALCLCRAARRGRR